MRSKRRWLRFLWLVGKGVRFTFFLRFQLLIAVVLAGGGPCVVWLGWGRKLLGNLFILQPSELFFVSWIALIVAWIVMVTAQIVLRNMHHRVGVKRLATRISPILDPKNHTQFLYGLLALPLIVITAIESTGPAWLRTLYTVAGVAAAFLCLFVSFALTRELIGKDDSLLLMPSPRLRLDSTRRSRFWVVLRTLFRPVVWALRGPWVKKLFRCWLFRDGYIDQRTGSVRVGHQLAMAMFVVVYGVYWLVFALFSPKWGFESGFPALGYVLILLLAAGWTLPAVAFLFDRWRIPVALTLVLVLGGLHWASNTEHYFRVFSKEERAERQARQQPGGIPDATGPAPIDRLTPRDAFARWVDSSDAEAKEKLIVIASSGGGITASSWTAHVLTGLERRFRNRFTRSLQVISSVSGGSVGSMYYLSGYQRDQARSDEELTRIVARASAPSLAATAWGLAYPDLWRIVLPPVMLIEPSLDRAWAMEHRWRRLLPAGGSDTTLDELRIGIQRGRAPVPLFNAVVVESGERFVLAPVDLSTCSGVCVDDCLAFRQEFAGRDIRIVTAARLSASFPWVTPISRASRKAGGRGYHFGDGGYFDNFGIVTLVEWLDAVLETFQAAGGKEVLVIRIEAFPPTVVSDEELDKRRGSMYAAVGPVIGLLRARTTTQRSRNDSELENLARRWRKETGPAEDDESAKGLVIRQALFRLPCSEAPLSWQLSPAESNCIEDAWRDEMAGGDGLNAVIEFLKSPEHQGDARSQP